MRSRAIAVGALLMLMLSTAASADAFPTTGYSIWTIAGTGSSCVDPIASPACGDGGLATSAQLNFPRGVAVDGAGNVYMGDQGDRRIRRIGPDGVIVTVAGNGTQCPDPTAPCGDGGPATSAQLAPGDIAVDAAGNLVVTDLDDNRVRKVTPGGNITAFAGSGAPCLVSTSACGDGGPANAAQLNNPMGVAVDSAGTTYIADGGDLRVRAVSPGGTITTVAGTGNSCSGPCGDGGAALAAGFSFPTAVATGTAGAVYVVDQNDARVRKFTPGGSIAAFAGSGAICGSPTALCGDGGAATAAQFTTPQGVVADGAGNVYISDSNNRRVRRVGPGGVINGFAGDGNACAPAQAPCGDGGAASVAHLTAPVGITLDAAGDLLVADSVHRLRWVTGQQRGPRGSSGSGGAPGSNGAGGQSGPNGSAGQPGVGGRFGLRAFATKRLRGNRVRVSFVMTHRAPVALEVKGASGKARTVARATGHAGVNAIVWNGRLAGRRAKAGRYRLTIVATVKGKKLRSTISAKVPRR